MKHTNNFLSQLFCVCVLLRKFGFSTGYDSIVYFLLEGLSFYLLCLGPNMFCLDYLFLCLHSNSLPDRELELLQGPYYFFHFSQGWEPCAGCCLWSINTFVKYLTLSKESMPRSYYSIMIRSGSLHLFFNIYFSLVSA